MLFVPVLCLSIFAVCISFAVVEQKRAWPKVGRFLCRILRVGRWKVACPTCHGTGIVQGHRKDAMPFIYTHACNGRCDNALINRTEAPSDFVGGTISVIHPSKGKDQTFVVVGSGWYYGSLWEMLWHGWWKGQRQ